MEPDFDEIDIDECVEAIKRMEEMESLLLPFFDKEYKKAKIVSYRTLIKSRLRALVELCERVGF